MDLFTDLAADEFFSVKNNDPKKKSKSCTECSSRWYTEESE